MKKMVVHLFSVGLMSFFLAGCLVAKNVEPNHVVDASNNTGVIIGTLTSPYTSKPKGPYLQLHPEDEDLFSIIQACPCNLEEEDFRGTLFALEVPAGVHRFDKWSMHNRVGTNMYPLRSPPDLEFTVGPGEIVYLGNFHFHVSIHENWFGRLFASNPIVEIRDETERDLKLIQKLYPGLSQQGVTVKLLPRGRWGEPGTRETEPPIIIFI